MNYLFCPLGGSGEIGMNMNLFAYGQPGEHKWIMVDIGVTFADDTIPGVDLIYPDPGFIVDKKDRPARNNFNTCARRSYWSNCSCYGHSLNVKFLQHLSQLVLIKEKFKEKNIDITNHLKDCST
jgi:ribonuclease J